LEPHGDEQLHNLDHPFRDGDGEDDLDKDGHGDADIWEEENYSKTGDDTDSKTKADTRFGSFSEERDAWGAGGS
jgi:hypothetical protein